ncbi:response regulator transcription factor [Roseomonas pecuniae]|uniref:Regulatory protein VirG n=2 Tax=Muricoccus pecuniae TaxID=693023 RepID=A0A840Y9V6_9PROT|nr:two-component system OmpR family response regulator [Roseomonas pecuniae]
MPHVLIVDDDEDILALLTRFLQNHGYRVSVACDGADMFAALDGPGADVIVLDVMLPDENGFDLCRRLRMVSQRPVIMLTAVSDHTDRVVGLELGADDYITKPLNARELLARIKTVLRRSRTGVAPRPGEICPVLCFGRLRLDIARRELRSENNMLVPLSAREFDLLLAFVEQPQRVLTRDTLMDLARGESHDAIDRSIDVQVSRLRRKLEDPFRSPELIRTVCNSGYILTAQVTRS